MSSQPTLCRLCEGSCGLLAELRGGAISSLKGDATDPNSEGYLCEDARKDALGGGRPRVTQAMKRVNGALVPIAYDTAIAEIGAALKKLRKESGPAALGLYLGAAAERHNLGLLRALAVGVGLGTPNLFGEQSLGAGPQIGAAEGALGHPVRLLPDLGRAHYVVLVGGDPQATGWGPGVGGMVHEAQLRHSRKTKGTKVVVADPQRTAFAAEMDQHVAIRPGTEPFFLLGLLSAIVRGNQRDVQFVDDYTRGWEALGAALGPWPLERCAEICGVEAPQLSGIALKLSRSAMSAVWLGPSALQNAHASLGAWAWLALHTVTANTLRPGGLYDHEALIDPHLLYALLPSAKAPRSRGAGQPNLLLQAAAAALLPEVLEPGEGQVKALISLRGDPVARLGAVHRAGLAFEQLELLVSLTDHEDETTARAHYVLPLPSAWERADVQLLDAAIAPRLSLHALPALLPPSGEARPEEDVLAAIFEQVKPGIRGGVYGAHVALVARQMATADLRGWAGGLLEWAQELTLDALEAPPHRITRGESNRALWRVTTADEKIHLLPAAIEALLGSLRPPAALAAGHLRLRTSRSIGRLGGRLPATSRARLHPTCGLADGSTALIRTSTGSLRAVVDLDPTLRPDTVDLRLGRDAVGSDLIGADVLDPFLLTPALDGAACAVSAA